MTENQDAGSKGLRGNKAEPIWDGVVLVHSDTKKPRTRRGYQD